MALQVNIDWAGIMPDEVHEVSSLLYEVAREVRDCKVGPAMDRMHKYGGTLTASTLAGWEHELRELADRVREVRVALSEVES